MHQFNTSTSSSSGKEDEDAIAFGSALKNSDCVYYLALQNIISSDPMGPSTFVRSIGHQQMTSNCWSIGYDRMHDLFFCFESRRGDRGRNLSQYMTKQEENTGSKFVLSRARYTRR